MERLVRSVQELQTNSCNQAFLGLTLEASHMVAAPHLLQTGGGGQESFRWQYMRDDALIGCFVYSFSKSSVCPKTFMSSFQMSISLGLLSAQEHCKKKKVISCF